VRRYEKSTDRTGSAGVGAVDDGRNGALRDRIVAAYIESFNGRLRDECLNDHWFTSLAHAEVVSGQRQPSTG